MKELKSLKKINEEIEYLKETIYQLTVKGNKDYQSNILKIIKAISIGEELDFNMLVEKYIKTKSDSTESDSPENKGVVLLNKITENDITYYVQTTNNLVYNTESVIIGTYCNGKIVFNKDEQIISV
jgi:hypothetical protein